MSYLPDGKPVIGLTTRGDRFDSLMFTLLHECAHLVLGHITSESEPIFNSDSIGSHRSPREEAADNLALEWLFPTGLSLSIASLGLIAGAAKNHGVHESVVIGQIQRMTQNWSLHRTRIPRVRNVLQSEGLFM